MTNEVVIAWVVLAGVPLIPVALTLFNVLTWPRGRSKGNGGNRHSAKQMPGPVSILIPARNEAKNIRACLESVLGLRHPVLEVLVYDDESTDNTGEIVKEFAARDRRVRLIKGQRMPGGWVGKPHACANLGQSAAGEVFLYLDADTRLEQDALERIADLFATYQADLVTVVPRQEVHSFGERLVMPLLHLTYTSWFPILLTWKSRDPRFLAANGQVFAVRRQVYESLGGFASVKDEMVDDMALARRAKHMGARVVFGDGFQIARCRMYGSMREIIRGFSKNIYEGLGANAIVLCVVLTLYVSAFVLPYLALPIAAANAVNAIDGDGSIWAQAAMIGVAANLFLRGLLAVRFSHPWEGVLLHPLSVLAFVGIAVNSFVWNALGKIEWRGRTYASRKVRRARTVGGG